MDIKRPKVEITIPVYNEEAELKKNIDTLINFCKKKMTDYNWQITIADNASTDTTPALASLIAKEHPTVTVHRLAVKGRGRAVKEVWSQKKADYYAYMDLDLSTDLVHLPVIIHALQNGYDLAIGSRLAKGARVEGRTLVREITSRVLNFLFIQLLFKTHFTDAQCGFKAVTSKVVHDLIPKVLDNEWFFDGELLIIAEKSGYRIYEEPVHWIDNPGSTVRLMTTISGDMKAMWRLFLTKPWKKIKK